MTVETAFANVEACPVDPVMDIMDKYSRDTYQKKIDVSVGVYKSEDGSVFTLPSIKEAKRRLAANDPGHSYTNMRGIPEYIEGARKVIFGPATSTTIASVQTISGTGAIHMGMAFLNKIQRTKYVIGVPAWDNYIPMVKHMGGEVQTYRHYDPQTGRVDFDALLTAIREVPAGSVFILQACCHNPTGADYSREQWEQIASAISKYNHFTLFDIAYQGLASGSLDEDAWPVRYFMDQKMEFMVCQSFSKNLGLYSERAGCLHVVGRDSVHVQNVQSQLVSLFRLECSFAPAFGARLVAQITNDEKLRSQWLEEVFQLSARIKKIRHIIMDKLVKLETPGKWDHVVKQKGMFWYSGLSQNQVRMLIDDYHVYMTLNGRVNVTGLNSSNIDYFCRSIDQVVRTTSK